MSSALPPNEDNLNAAPVEANDASALKGDEASSEETTSSYIALKYTFFTPKRGELCGAFCVVFEGETGKILFQAFWVTRSDSLSTLKTSEDWRTFNKLLSHIGPYDKVWGDKLTPLLEELLPTADRIKLYQEKAQSQTPARVLTQIKGAVRKGYERVTHYFLDVSCDAEIVSRDELVEAGLLEASPGTEAPSEAEAEGGESKSFSGLLVQCLPIIDPIHGKAVTELVPGDILEVQIQNSIGAGGLVQQFLQATKQSPVFPVDSIERRDEKTYVYLTINEEMHGLLTLTKDLRLKTQYTVVNKQKQTGLIDNLIFFLLLSVALWGFVLALRYFL